MRNSDLEVLHLTSPTAMPWNSLVTPISKILRVPLVPYEEWFKRLEGLELHAETRKIPAMRLLNFFRTIDFDSKSKGCEVMGLPKLSIEESVKVSHLLKQVGPASQGDVMKWLAYWKLIDTP